jgi:superfamily II DNA/RNA helicase
LAEARTWFIQTFINALIHSLLIPDLWQQEAVRALRDGRDVVVQAPTGAGKTLIVERFVPELRGQMVFTVPTRALANDKLAEWRARGWDVGIATGDLALNLDAKVVVATLETQKRNFLQRTGPRLLVVDEYQMIADAVRGVNYELALAMAPPKTQLLLLSGSVGNPQDVVAWLRRIGRDAVLISHHERPVPLEEVDLEMLPNRGPQRLRGWWTRLIVNALHAQLGPVLLFAPRRRAAEELARELAAALPPGDSLALTPEQERLAGPALAKLLRQRAAFHHSGLSYAQRAGLVEPLAKNGQLRVVVATMGLAAGINFSMRSVVVTGTTYMAGNFERQVQPDELLQMFGRAGRRGLDEVGYVLLADKTPRLHDARPLHLRRSTKVDWPTLIAVMRAAAARGEPPFAAALEVNRHLFTAQEIPLGIEHSLMTGPMPCGLAVDMERARFHRRGVLEIVNSRGEWEPKPAASSRRGLGECLVRDGDRWRPALSVGRTLHGIGLGNLCKLSEGKDRRYGRELALGTRRGDGTLSLTPQLKRLLKVAQVTSEEFEREVVARLPELIGGQVTTLEPRGHQLVARLDFARHEIEAWTDSHGAALLDPPERRELPLPCRGCVESPWCGSVEIINTPAFAWRRLGLIEPDGTPMRRGVIFSFFHHGEGLAIAAALEDATYAMDDLIFDLANLRAGPRFAEDDSPFGGRLGAICQRTYERADWPGYLEMGVPPEYGSGAAEIVRAIVEHSTPRQKLTTESLRTGDIERGLIEWRSLLRHIVWAPDYEWERWRELKAEAARYIETTESPVPLDLPPLTAAQQRRER